MALHPVTKSLAIGLAAGIEVGIFGMFWAMDRYTTPIAAILAIVAGILIGGIVCYYASTVYEIPAGGVTASAIGMPVGVGAGVLVFIFAGQLVNNFIAIGAGFGVGFWFGLGIGVPQGKHQTTV